MARSFDACAEFWLRFKHGHQLQTHLKLWEMEVPKDDVQNIESCFVSIRDQGWGNEGLIISLAMQLGPYVVLLSSRGFKQQERQEVRRRGPNGHAGGIWLIDDSGYNFSGFSDKTVVPKGASKLYLIAAGRLMSAGHQMFYNGVYMRISTLQQ